MELASERIRALCRKKKLSLNSLLRAAGVSKTAYYSLKRRRIMVPISALRICKVLDVEPPAILKSISTDTISTLLLQEKLEQIMRRHRNADRENIWHTLLLLEEKPIARLNRALLRGTYASHLR